MQNDVPENHDLRLVLRHELRSEGLWDLEFAPWVLTVFKRGDGFVELESLGELTKGGRYMKLWMYH